MPIKIENIPRLNAVLISHNHYDHLDYNSVFELNEKFGSDVTWFVPLGLSGWFKDSGVVNVIEFDWWETKPFKSVQVTFTPGFIWIKYKQLLSNKV